MSIIFNLFGRKILNIVFNNFNAVPNFHSSPSSLLSSTTRLLSSSKSPKKTIPFKQYENLPPISPLSGKGNNFETRIVRKRVIQDPNLPSLDSIGELKWGTTRMLRDARRRRVFIDYYPFRQYYYNMRKCRSLPNSIREEAFRMERELPRDSNFHLPRNRCAVTGRSRGIIKRYRLSRLCWRNLADYNKLSGVIKACWS